MSQIEKLKEKFFSKPVRNDIGFDETRRLAEYYGCKVFSGGKHPIRIADIPSQKIITIPRHGKYVKEAYIKELTLMFEEIENRR